MSIVMPPARRGDDVFLTVQRGSTGVLFTMHQDVGGVHRNIAELVVTWDKLGGLIDKLQEWQSDGSPKHHHIIIDPAAIGSAAGSLGG